MNHLGAGSRSSRSLYGKIVNVAHEQIGFDSQQSLEPIIPAAKRTYTVQSVSSPQERFLEYEKVELGDVSTPKPAHTFGRSLEAPKEAIRKGLFWRNSHKLLPHLAAGAVTAAVVQLSFRNEYCMDLVDPRVEILPGITHGGALNVLQLAVSSPDHPKTVPFMTYSLLLLCQQRYMLTEIRMQSFTN